MRASWIALAIVCLVSLLPAAGRGQAVLDVDPIPSLTATGRAEVSARPDRATVQLGAVAQADEAAAAQQQVNRVMQKAVDQLKRIGIPAEAIQTRNLSLSPVYRHAEGKEPAITGYRASNTVEVRLDQLDQVGQVIDTAVAAGANQLQGVSFDLKDDLSHKQAALRQAVSDAQAKARAMASAAGVRLERVVELVEGPVNVVRPQLLQARAAFAGAANATPVQPGEVRVEASVTIRYRIDDAPRERAVEEPAR